MTKEMSVREWQVAFANGEFDASDFKTQVNAGWYDWFCKDSSLANKTKRLGKAIMKIKDGGKIDLDKCYVWFKNNCPLVGRLYDDFRFADIETGKVLYTIAVNDDREEYKYSVWGKDNDFREPIIGFNDMRNLASWFNAA